MPFTSRQRTLHKSYTNALFLFYDKRSRYEACNLTVSLSLAVAHISNELRALWVQRASGLHENITSLRFKFDKSVTKKWLHSGERGSIHESKRGNKKITIYFPFQYLRLHHFQPTLNWKTVNVFAVGCEIDCFSLCVLCVRALHWKRANRRTAVLFVVQWRARALHSQRVMFT